MRHHALAPLAAPLLVLGAALALAGCEKKAETAPASEEAVPAATALPPPSAAASFAAEVPGSIPMALRGRWGLVPLDCTGDPAAAKGLIDVDATSIKFYESVAKLGKVKSGDDSAIDATFAFTGEGQEWALDVDLKIEDGQLVRKDTGRDAQSVPGPGLLKYTRCA